MTFSMHDLSEYLRQFERQRFQADLVLTSSAIPTENVSTARHMASGSWELRGYLLVRQKVFPPGSKLFGSSVSILN